jgi:hypothetical protein
VDDVDSEARLRAAELAAAEGDAARVSELYAGASGIDEGTGLRWGLLLAEVGRSDLAAEVAAKLAGSAPGAHLAEVLAGGADEIDPETDDHWLEPPVVIPRPGRDEPTAELFIRWFGGRRDLYARQWFDERRRRSGYRPIEEPLTNEVARAHLEGRMTIGQYLLFPDATVSYGVLDLDLGANALSEWKAAMGDGAIPAEHPILRAYARRLIDAGHRLGLPLWPEDSGSRGVHLWLFLEPRRPARAARALLSQVLISAGAQPAEVGVEVFPKQDRPGQKGLSSLVKLPLGIHQQTLRRCALLDEHWRPIPEARVALERLSAAPADLVADVVGRRRVPLPAPELEPSEGAPPLPRTPNARSMAEALRGIAPGAEEQQACERMLAGCTVLRKLVAKGYEQRRLAPAEARALLYTVGLVGPSCTLIEEIFVVAQVSKAELLRVRRSLPSPTGCKRLRLIAPELAKDCRCPEGHDAEPYPTPAVFAVGRRAPASPTWAPFAPWVEGEAILAADPLATIAEWLRRIEGRLERLERDDEGE